MQSDAAKAAPLIWALCDMMFRNEPLLRRTNQAWKLSLSVVSSLLAFLLLGLSIAKVDLGIERLYVYYLIGLLATIGLFLNFRVKCPKCGSRWLWGMSKYPTKYRLNDKGVIVQKCPRCGLSSEDVT